MILLHQIGVDPQRPNNANFNTLDEILACDEPLSFDGVYESVYENFKALKGKDVTFFVSGKYVGGDNAFDVHNGQPLSRFCTIKQIFEMRDYLGARIGYHGWAHLHCHMLKSDGEIRAEIAKPDWIETDLLAWPYGDMNQRCCEIAAEMGYKEAWSVYQGDGSQFQRNRRLLR